MVASNKPRGGGGGGTPRRKGEGGGEKRKKKKSTGNQIRDITRLLKKVRPLVFLCHDGCHVCQTYPWTRSDLPSSSLNSLDWHGSTCYIPYTRPLSGDGPGDTSALVGSCMSMLALALSLATHSDPNPQQHPSSGETPPLQG